MANCDNRIRCSWKSLEESFKITKNIIKIMFAFFIFAKHKIKTRKTRFKTQKNINWHLCLLKIYEDISTKD